MGTFDGYPVAPLVDGVDSRELIAYDVMYAHDAERLAMIEPKPSFSKRCSHPLCGGNSQPRNDLFVVKEHHDKFPTGYLRSLCREHRDDYENEHADRLGGWSASPTRVRARAARAREQALETMGDVCPTCWQEKSASGACACE